MVILRETIIIIIIIIAITHLRTMKEIVIIITIIMYSDNMDSIICHDDLMMITNENKITKCTAGELLLGLCLSPSASVQSF